MSSDVKNPLEIATYDHTAGFPGSGPTNKLCRDCLWFMGREFDNFDSLNGRCIMFVKLCNEEWRLEKEKNINTRLGGWDLISASTPSCNYFRGRDT